MSSEVTLLLVVDISFTVVAVLFTYVLVHCSNWQDKAYTWLYHQQWWLKRFAPRLVKNKIGNVTGVCTLQEFDRAKKRKSFLGPNEDLVFVQEMLLFYDGVVPSELPPNFISPGYEMESLVKDCRVTYERRLFVPGGYRNLLDAAKKNMFGTRWQSKKLLHPNLYARTAYVWGKHSTHRFPPAQEFAKGWFLAIDVFMHIPIILSIICVSAIH